MPLQYFLMLASPTPSGASSGAKVLGIALPASARKPPLPNEKPEPSKTPGLLSAWKELIAAAVGATLARVEPRLPTGIQPVSLSSGTSWSIELINRALTARQLMVWAIPCAPGSFRFSRTSLQAEASPRQRRFAAPWRQRWGGHTRYWSSGPRQRRRARRF